MLHLFGHKSKTSISVDNYLVAGMFESVLVWWCECII